MDNVIAPSLFARSRPARTFAGERRGYMGMLTIVDARMNASKIPTGMETKNYLVVPVRQCVINSRRGLLRQDHSSCQLHLRHQVTIYLPDITEEHITTSTFPGQKCVLVFAAWQISIVHTSVLISRSPRLGVAHMMPVSHPWIFSAVVRDT
jgi:hypothetical protein